MPSLLRLIQLQVVLLPLPRSRALPDSRAAELEVAAAAEPAARRALQRSITDLEASDLGDLLAQGCVDDAQGFLELYGMACSQLTEHTSRAACEANGVGFVWEEEDDDHPGRQATCKNFNLQDVVQMYGCDYWFLPDMYMVADLCPFTCYACEGVEFDPLNRLFIDREVEVSEVLVHFVNGAIKKALFEYAGGAIPRLNVQFDSLAGHSISFGDLSVVTEKRRAEDASPQSSSIVDVLRAHASGAEVETGASSGDLGGEEVVVTIRAPNTMLTVEGHLVFCTFPPDAEPSDDPIGMQCIGGETGCERRGGTWDSATERCSPFDDERDSLLWHHEGSTAFEFHLQLDIELPMVFSSPNLSTIPPCLPAGEGFPHNPIEQASCSWNRVGAERLHQFLTDLELQHVDDVAEVLTALALDQGLEMAELKEMHREGELDELVLDDSRSNLSEEEKERFRAAIAAWQLPGLVQIHDVTVELSGRGYSTHGGTFTSGFLEQVLDVNGEVFASLVEELEAGYTASSIISGDGDIITWLVQFLNVVLGAELLAKEANEGLGCLHQKKSHVFKRKCRFYHDKRQAPVLSTKAMFAFAWAGAHLRRWRCP
jgi:hypothetical protein